MKRPGCNSIFLTLDESTGAIPALSPGPVQDQETLLRIIIEPDHINEGRIQPSAVQLRDLTQRGLSVHRREYTTEQEIRTAAQLGFTISSGVGEGIYKPVVQGDWEFLRIGVDCGQ